MVTSKATNILLIDDHSLFREGLGRLLQSEPGFRVVGNCNSVRDGLAVLEKQQVDIVLLDFDLGEENGMLFQKEAARWGFKGKILLVTAGMTDREVVNVLEKGVSGIFLKSSTPDQLLDAINRVIRGEQWLDPKAMKAVISAATEKSQERAAGPEELNQRERAVLKGILEGLANKEIAAELNISESLVKAVIQQLFNKTGVRTRGQLVRIVLERRDRGWIR